MTIALTDLHGHLGELLDVGSFDDYCPNGLQVEGRGRVTRLATGVSASQALIEQAIEWGADAILVHHGYFWKGESAVVTGMKRRRLAALLGTDTSLLAYHLPLDAHPEYGNNACFGRALGVASAGTLRGSLCWAGEFRQPRTVAELLAHIEAETGREPLHIGADPAESVQRIAWCTGAAQGYIDTAVASGARVYITGEVSEQTVHTAREEGIHFIAAGHHATERYGVRELGAYLAREFGVEHRFLDIDNPV